MANFDALDRKNCSPLPYAACFEEALLNTLELFTQVTFSEIALWIRLSARVHENR